VSAGVEVAVVVVSAVSDPGLSSAEPVALVDPGTGRTALRGPVSREGIAATASGLLAGLSPTLVSQVAALDAPDGGVVLVHLALVDGISHAPAGTVFEPLSGLLGDPEVREAATLLRRTVEDPLRGLLMLPEVFTLAQLRSLLSALRGRETDPRNFRRRVVESGVLTEVGSFSTRGLPGRPPTLYRLAVTP